jgi:hypothetical protein
MKLPPLPRRDFFRFQSERLTPVVFSERDKSFAAAREMCGKEVRVEIDCQWDTDRDKKNSCTEFLDNEITLNLHAEVVTSKEDISAQAMEAEGSGRGLTHLVHCFEGTDKRIVEVVHDDNASVDTKIASLPGVHNSKDMWQR